MALSDDQLAAIRQHARNGYCTSGEIDALLNEIDRLRTPLVGGVLELVERKERAEAEIERYRGDLADILLRVRGFHAGADVADWVESAIDGNYERTWQ